MKNRYIVFTTIILFAFGSLALSPTAQAMGPDTEGAIPGSNNGEGVGVLVSRTGGVWNTGTGYQALIHSRTTQSATTTRPTVIKRSIATPPQSKTPPLAPARF